MSTNLYFCLLYLFLSATNLLSAQLDTLHVQGPYFSGRWDGDTSKFVFENGTHLRSWNAGNSETIGLHSNVWTPNPDSAYRFYWEVELDLAPSGSNQYIAYFSENLFWKLGESGSNDPIRVFWQDENGTSELMVFDSLFPNGGRFEIQLQYYPQMGYFLLLGPEENPWEIKPLSLPTTLNDIQGRWEVRHTSTKGTNFYLHQFESNYIQNIDTLPPFLIHSTWVSPQQIELTFNESILLQNVYFNRFLSDFHIDNNVLTLTFNPPFNNGDTLISTTFEIQDIANNTTNVDFQKIYYDTYYPIEKGDIEITAFQVTPPEMIVLSNLSDHAITLNELSWKDASSNVLSFPDSILLPGNSFIWSKDSLAYSDHNGHGFPNLNDYDEQFFLLKDVDTLQHWEVGSDFDRTLGGAWGKKWRDAHCYSGLYWVNDSSLSNYQLTDSLMPQLDLMSAERLDNSNKLQLIWNNPSLIHPASLTALTSDTYSIQSTSIVNTYQVIEPVSEVFSIQIEDVLTCRLDTQDFTAQVLWPIYDILTYGSLKLNEVMYEPESGQSEYMEYFGTSSHPFWVDSLYFIFLDEQGDSLFSEVYQGVIPNGYPTFTESTILDLEYDFVDTTQIININLPSLKSENTTVFLYESRHLIDSCTYTPSFHASFIDETRGVALEKSLENSGQDQFSSATADFNFATPTRVNSLILQKKEAQNNFSLSSHVWSDKELFFLWDVPEPIVLSLECYDIQGNWLKTLHPKRHVSSQGSMSIELYSSYNLAFPSGIYIILVDAIGIESRKKYRKRLEIGVYRP